jgi:hypothetical protein
VMVRLHWNSTISPLIDVAVTHRLVPNPPSFRVNHAQAMHDCREFASAWPNHQVPMIRHEAVGEQPRSISIECVPQHGFERGVVGCIVKDSTPIAASVQDVEDDASASCERSFRHDEVRFTKQRQCRVDSGRNAAGGL